MASQEVTKALEELHLQLNRLEPAIRHVEAAEQVTQMVKTIPEKHIALMEEVKAEQMALAKVKEAVQAFYERVDKINFPERLDKLDANVAGIMAAMQAVQSRLDTVERNIIDRLRDMHDYHKETRTSLQQAVRRQQLLTFITWLLVIAMFTAGMLIK